MSVPFPDAYQIAASYLQNKGEGDDAISAILHDYNQAMSDYDRGRDIRMTFLMDMERAYIIVCNACGYVPLDIQTLRRGDYYINHNGLISGLITQEGDE